MSILIQREICSFCGTASPPGKCAMSPSGNHRFITGWDKCGYCLRNAYGNSCPHSSEKRKQHKHGHGNRKCRWCGSTNVGKTGCPYSPHGAHEK